MDVKLLKLRDESYPQILKDIPDPPSQLYYTGLPLDELLKSPKVAIVGSRKATPYGRQVTIELSTSLARAAVVIVSGLAFGIDSYAHRTALEAGGQTIAVLPTSLDNIYPSSHWQLAQQILKSGGLMSEYSPRTEGFPVNFIARNRIVSGLADVLLITEAAKNSGTMHTARFALEQGKTVMAVPGNITSPISEGCNNLIKSGATPVTNVDDIFFALKINPQTAKAKVVFQGKPQEQLVFELISQGVIAQEEIAASAKLSSSDINSALTMLELGGYIRAQGAGHWTIA